MSTGFFHQLRLLLWKNFTLKKRKPLVLLFELFIPLVLFFILLGIRRKQPAHAKPASYFSAEPLPSAGVTSIAQAFCDHGERDSDGFHSFPNSTLNQFLEQFNTIAKNNNFFDSGFSPRQMDILPQVYKSIIEDPVAIHDHFEQAQEIKFSSLLRDKAEFHDFLVNNLTMTNTSADRLMNSELDLREVFQILFGTSKHHHGNQNNHKHNRDHVHHNRKHPHKQKYTKKYIKYLRRHFILKRSLSSNLVKHVNKTHWIDDPVKKLLNYIPRHIARPVNSHSMRGVLSQHISQDIVSPLGGVLNGASTIQHKRIVPPIGLFYKYLRSDSQSATKLRQIFSKLMSDSSLSQKDINKYMTSLLIKDVLLTPESLRYMICEGHSMPLYFNSTQHYPISNTSKAYNVLCEKNSTELAVLSDELTKMIDMDKIEQLLNMSTFNIHDAQVRIKRLKEDVILYMKFQHNLFELGEFSESLPNDDCPLPEQISTTASHVTTPVSDGDQSRKNTPTEQHNKYAGLFKIWAVLQKTICGKESKISNEKMAQFETSSTVNLDDIGLSWKQQQSFRILLHVLYGNPKLLYSPNNTQADDVIRKANATFAVLGRITQYATKWINVSHNLRQYLLQNSTLRNLQTLKEIQDNFRHPGGVFQYLPIPDPEFNYFVHNATIPNRDAMLKQLDTIDDAACSWKKLTKGISLNVFRGFKTEEEIVDYVLHQAYKDNVTVLASVIFTNMKSNGALPAHVVYKIRQNASFTQNTKKIRPTFWFPGPERWGYKYYQFGFVWIQDVIERAIIDVQTGSDIIEPGSYIQQFPYPCYLSDQFLFMIEHVMPLCLTISWVYFVAMLCQNIVYEKELRLKEVMRMMGMSNSVHYVAWFISSFTQMTITIGCVTAILKFGLILTYSNAFIVFLVLEMFAIATISFCFLISVLYSKAKLAAACAGIVYFLTYVPYMYIAIKEEAAGDKISAATKTLASLSSTTAFGLGAKYFAFYEIEGVGVQWDNIGQSPIEGDEYNLYTVVIMMFVDAILYCVLSWYIENIHPGSYGLPKPWYFPFTKAYWTDGHIRTESEQCSWRNILKCFKKRAGLSLMEDEQACAMASTDGDRSRYFEGEPEHLRLGVCIDNLVKVYKTGKMAVNKLSLNLYEGHITSFLGHNGAGKTSTMSILTGLFPPTDGYATIYGHDIRTEMSEIRKSLGMCPQHNVLFDRLTVEEHLWFYAALKGMKFKDVHKEMDRMINDVGLPKKRHSTVDCLSGGMQRKLSVAIAFVAGSRTVILDEPTAGIDPYARRAIWEMLLKYKQGRTILLSTHHMDEADLLGDRIAIISNGQLKCCGSSLFLKSTFGDGYHLRLVKKPSDADSFSSATNNTEDDLNESHQSNISFITKCDQSKVTSFIMKYVSTAYLKTETSHELHYILPFEEARKGSFERLFQSLESSSELLDISSYGVVDTSLEEVFLKIADQTAVNKDSLPDPVEEEDDVLLAEDLPPRKPVSALGHRRQASDISILSRLMLGDDDLELSSISSANTTDTKRYRHRRQHSDASRATVTSSSKIHKHKRQKSDPFVFTRQFSQESKTSGSLHDIVLPNFNNFTERGTTAVNVENDSTAVDDQRLDDIVTGSRNGGYSRIRSEDYEDDADILGGAGSYVVTGSWLKAKQFLAVILKRFYYIKRNWKGLFSQILLPALFVSVAMTVALSAPKVSDLPPLVMSPAQYYNYTQPQGTFMPYTDEKRGQSNASHRLSHDLIRTLHLPSGLSATCVLKSPFNSTYDALILSLVNRSRHTMDFKLLTKYFEPGCESVFRPGIPVMNFMPAPKITELPINSSSSSGLPPTSTQHDHYYPKCQCAADGSGFICEKNGYTHAKGIYTVTHDVLIDITGQDASQYFLNTLDNYRLSRYGALSFDLQRDYVPPKFGQTAPSIFKKLAVKNVAKVWYNDKGYHAMPSYLNVLNNAILRASLPRSKGNPAAYGITLVNHPMNNTNLMLSLNLILQGSDVLISIFIIVAMSFVPASFVLFLVYERSTKSKHLQFVSGIDPVIYWIANYTWDMCNYLIPGTCCIIILLIFDLPAYVSKTNFPAVIALFLMYGWSITPMMYPASFVFKEPSTAYIFLIVINLFIGITCIITSFMLEMFQYDHDLKQVHSVLKLVFTVFPNYCLGRGLMDIAFNEYKNEYFIKTGQLHLIKSPFQWKLTTRSLVAMAVMGLVFFIITLLCEFNFFRKQKKHNLSRGHVENEDEDVKNERKRVLRGSGKKDLIRLENLTKVYKTRKLGHHLAVDRLCLAVPQGECFGLLGVNGAGKSTTFKMLTGDIAPSSGEAFLNEHSILKDMLKVQQCIGYCPQIDALYDELTAREHLQLYARLRGVPFKDEKRVVEWALKKLALVPYADKPSVTYSGGNKRKLSTAIALIGHPPIIFLDEPTTGMDPHSRRFLWDLILGLVKEGRSVILTSHSMEECEVLCGRLAIMVNGRFKCLGSTQHLKNRFGEGYTVTIRVKGHDLERSLHLVMRFIERNFADAVLKEQHHNIVQYELRTSHISLAHVFSKMEEAQRDLQVEDYSVSQNTLDNVFINFVKQQVEIQEEHIDNEVNECNQPHDQGQLEANLCDAINDNDDVPLLIADTANNTTDDIPLLFSQEFRDDVISDDDVPLISDEGTHLSFLNMEPFRV